MKKLYFVLFLSALMLATNFIFAQTLSKKPGNQNKLIKNHPSVNMTDNLNDSQKPVRQNISNYDNIKRIDPGYINDHITANWYVDPLGTDNVSHGTGTGVNAFKTIQYAINFTGVFAGDIINIAAGTYVENVTLNKSLHLIGSGASTILIPAFSDVGLPDPTTGGSFRGSQMIVVSASNVEIAYIKIDGNNPSLTSGYVKHGVDIDARNGIITADPGPYTNVVVHHCTVQNIYLRGIYARTSDVNFNFHDNTVKNVDGCYSSIAMFNFGGSGIFANNTVDLANDAVSSNWSTGTQYLNNTITNSGSGIHTDNNGGFGGVADLADGNNISNCSYGIFSFFPYFAPTIQNNTIFNADVGLHAWGGQTIPVSTIFTNNNVDCNNKPGSCGILVYTGEPVVWYWVGNVSATFTNNIIKNDIYIADVENYGTYTANSTLHNNSFINGPSGFVAVGATVNAQNNWWGTTDSLSIASLIHGAMNWIPWIGK